MWGIPGGLGGECSHLPVCLGSLRLSQSSHRLPPDPCGGARCPLSCPLRSCTSHRVHLRPVYRRRYDAGCGGTSPPHTIFEASIKPTTEDSTENPPGVRLRAQETHLTGGGSASRYAVDTGCRDNRHRDDSRAGMYGSDSPLAGNSTADHGSGHRCCIAFYESGAACTAAAATTSPPASSRRICCL